MTDEQLCQWLESTGFPQASDAAARLRDRNIAIAKQAAIDVTPPPRWPELGDIVEPPVELTDKAPVRRKRS